MLVIMHRDSKADFFLSLSFLFNYYYLFIFTLETTETSEISFVVILFTGPLTICRGCQFLSSLTMHLLGSLLFIYLFCPVSVPVSLHDKLVHLTQFTFSTSPLL